MDFFDIVAPIYDIIFPNKEYLCELIDFPKRGQILDIGGGTGRVSEMVDPGCSIIVVDRSLKMLDQTRKKEGMIAVCALAEALPFPNLKFHRILVIDAFHHFHHHQMVLAEIVRVMANKGRALIKEPDIKRLLIKIIAFLEKVLNMKSIFYSEDQFERMVLSLGCEYQITKTKNFYCGLLMK